MTQPENSTITFPSREAIPRLGQGTWGLGEDPGRRDDEIDALRTGIDLGLTVIDTAESYADGNAETLVGTALGNRREDVFLITKVSAENAAGTGAADACERSLRRLGTDRIDLYLLHWRGASALDETVETFNSLIAQGKIRHWGVSNFDVPDLSELTAISGGTAVETDQVLYNLARRSIEWDLLPRCREAHLPVMAYSPLERGRMLDHPALRTVAERHDATPAQVGLAWVLHQDGVCAIPRAGNVEHVRQNHAALRIDLTPDDLAELDRAFPPPTGPTPLPII
ncbi:aldo/keto reductase [Micromonospora sp. NPDC049559]|uniref:aldo/keto reductase n=1 Tax=Micromonospora sp. NPDC049559 TaxID=3155923 RepID=UPI003438F40B